MRVIGPSLKWALSKRLREREEGEKNIKAEETSLINKALQWNEQDKDKQLRDQWGQIGQGGKYGVH